MKKIVNGLLTAVLVGGALFGNAASAFAIDTWHIDTDRGGVSNVPYNIDDPATGQTHVMTFDVLTGYQEWFSPAKFRDEFLDKYFDYVHGTTLSAATTSLNASISSLQAQISGLGGSSFNMVAFMANSASTTPLIASSTSNGLMSSAMVVKLSGLSTSTVSTTTAGLMSASDKVKLDALSTSTATQTSNGLLSAADKIKLDSMSTSTPTANSSNRSLNTCYQISANRDAFVSYSVDVDTTLTLAGGATGQVALTTFTNSGCTTGSTVVQKAKAGLTGTLVVGLTINNPATVTLGGVVTRGLWAELVTTNITGTPTFTMNTTQEVTGSLVQ